MTGDDGDAKVVALGVDGRPEPAEGVARHRRRQREADRDVGGRHPGDGVVGEDDAECEPAGALEAQVGSTGSVAVTRARSPTPKSTPWVEPSDVVAVGTEFLRDPLCGEPSGGRAGVTADPPDARPLGASPPAEPTSGSDPHGHVFRRPKRGTLLYVLPV